MSNSSSLMLFVKDICFFTKEKDPFIILTFTNATMKLRFTPGVASSFCIAGHIGNTFGLPKFKCWIRRKWDTSYCNIVYRFPSLFAVETFRHFPPQFIEFVDKKSIFENWHFGPFFLQKRMSDFANEKYPNNDGHRLVLWGNSFFR